MNEWNEGEVAWFFGIWENAKWEKRTSAFRWIVGGKGEEDLPATIQGMKRYEKEGFNLIYVSEPVEDRNFAKVQSEFKNKGIWDCVTE